MPPTLQQQLSTEVVM